MTANPVCCIYIAYTTKCHRKSMILNVMITVEEGINKNPISGSAELFPSP
jgi:hypothetical protein